MLSFILVNGSIITAPKFKEKDVPNIAKILSKAPIIRVDKFLIPTSQILYVEVVDDEKI